LPDTDNIVLCRNNTPINQIKNAEHGAQIDLIKVIFWKGTVLSVSDKSESVNERSYTDQQNKIKFHNLGGSPEVPIN